VSGVLWKRGGGGSEVRGWLEKSAMVEYIVYHTTLPFFFHKNEIYEQSVSGGGGASCAKHQFYVPA
jgi:hypothetical protein